MQLDPANTTVVIDTSASPPAPGSVTYKLFANGSDVTAGASFSLADSSIGTFAGPVFTAASLPAGVMGKSTTVAGEASAGKGLGTLTVVQLRKSGANRDFFFVVPHNGDPSPTSEVLAFSTNIKQADVAFVMDTTNSMNNSIKSLKSALQGTLFTQLTAKIPNVGLAVVDFKDFFGGDPFGIKVRQTVTTNLALAQAAVGGMSASGGGDEPEAAFSAMFHALTGEAISGTPALPAHTPAPGTFGGAEFRAGSIPIVVSITDAHMKDPSQGVTLAKLVDAFKAAGGKFVAITETAYLQQFPDLEAKPSALSDATGSSVPPSAFSSVPGCLASQCCTGVNGANRGLTAPNGRCQLNFLSSDGKGVAPGIVAAIEAIAVGSTYDVKAVASNDPKNTGGVDATKFINTIRAMDEGNAANGCPPSPAKDTDGDGIKDTFDQLQVGTPVCFEIIPAKNTIVPPGVDPLFFNAFIDVVTVPGGASLDRRSVLFMVPPKTAGVN